MKNSIKSSGIEVKTTVVEKVTVRKCKFSYVEKMENGKWSESEQKINCRSAGPDGWHPGKDDVVLVFSVGEDKFVEPAGWEKGESEKKTEVRCAEYKKESAKEKEIEDRQVTIEAKIKKDQEEQESLRLKVVKTPAGRIG